MQQSIILVRQGAIGRVLVAHHQNATPIEYLGETIGVLIVGRAVGIGGGVKNAVDAIRKLVHFAQEPIGRIAEDKVPIAEMVS